MPYLPIESYGVIGDLHTAALVSLNGSIDWLCLPRFDSPSVFAAILDDAQGGRFQIAPARAEVTRKQMYFPDTNVLITRFLSPDGVAEVTDFMPIGEPASGHGRHELVRRVEVVRGSMPMRASCRPAFDYARAGHRVQALPGGVCFASRDAALGLTASVPLSVEGPAAVAEFELRQGEQATFLLSPHSADRDRPSAFSLEQTERTFRETVDYWHRWLAQCSYRGRWREMVCRSALALKLLTYAPTGAIVAAPTCMSRGWSPRRRAFVQAYDHESLDAANLIMPLVFFVSPRDPRFLTTLDAILGHLAKGSLVHRYDVEASPDGLAGDEGTFSMCTFWLVEALTRAGRLEEARLVFEKMLGYANHLGLYSEQVGSSGEALGNFPQAFTHLALISAAFNLDRRLGATA